MGVAASEKVWVCEKGHVDDHHLEDGGVCLTCGGEGGRTHTRAEPDCCGNLNSAGECRGDCAVPVEVEDVELCPGCNGTCRETNTLCSRCGGTCELKQRVAEGGPDAKG